MAFGGTWFHDLAVLRLVITFGHYDWPLRLYTTIVHKDCDQRYVVSGTACWAQVEAERRQGRVSTRRDGPEGRNEQKAQGSHQERTRCHQEHSGIAEGGLEIGQAGVQGGCGEKSEGQFV